MSEFDLGRRRVMQAVGAGLLLPGLVPAVIASVKDRPQAMPGGIRSHEKPERIPAKFKAAGFPCNIESPTCLVGCQ